MTLWVGTPYGYTQKSADSYATQACERFMQPNQLLRKEMVAEPPALCDGSWVSPQITSYVMDFSEFRIKYMWNHTTNTSKIYTN